MHRGYVCSAENLGSLERITLIRTAGVEAKRERGWFAGSIIRWKDSFKSEVAILSDIDSKEHDNKK